MVTFAAQRDILAAMTITAQPYDQIRVGDKAHYAKTISEQDVTDFARITGDVNPVHVDEEFARRSLFGRRIAHGFLSGSLFSTVLGTRFPGPGTIYLRQEMEFVKPVFIGDTITAECEVIEKKDDKKILTFRTTLRNQQGETVLAGRAVVLKHEGD